MVRLHTYYNLLFNGTNKLTKNVLKAFIKDNDTFISIITVLCVFTFNSILALGLPNLYIDVNLQKTIILAIELFV